jgi:hypothetical protein
MRPAVNVTLAIALFLVSLSGIAFAQEGQIAGTVRDPSGAVMPGVLVEVTSPALIEKVRSNTTDDIGQYRITNLPVGTYSITFTIEGFARQQRDNVVLTSGFTAPVNATMTVGQRTEVVTVTAETPTVDVQNARQVATFAGEDLRALPTARTVRSLMTLTPGLTQTGLGADCVGGAGVWCNPNIYNLAAHAPVSGDFNLDGDILSQGRIMVDGTVINSGSGSIQGLTGGYSADIANAQEVNIQISGALGESETGGAAINIVPRTGGNKFAGNYFTDYTRQSFFDTNSAAYPYLQVASNQIKQDHNVMGSFGGPIKRDRLWFYSVGRTWGKEAYQGDGQAIYNNLNSGKFGANYQPDRSTPPLTFTNLTRGFNTRITYQASAKNKFNMFWDEQLTCLDPCNGTVASWVTPESTWSGQVHPARLQQVSWTNPVTGKILLEAGLSVNTQFYDYSRHRYAPSVSSIPRVSEVGATAGGDAVSPFLNTTAGSSAFTALSSGPLNSAIGGLAETRDLHDYRTRASAAYVTGTHNAKIGFDGGYYSQIRRNVVNDPRLSYRYDTPAAGCYNAANPAASTCGNTSLYYPGDPYNLAMRPVPSRVTIDTGVGDVGARVQYNALFLQDQWTLKRLTLSGALRYDHATSNYLGTCVGPDKFVPLQSNGSHSYCTPASDGVNYNDLTPRWGATWDPFGKGKTSIKWTMGKYLSAAGITGVYNDANPALRTVNSIERLWNDTNGNRIPDCDLLNFAPNGECGGPSFTFPPNDPVRYGRDPLGLDAAGNPVGLATTECGRTEKGIPAAVQAYCDTYGQSLLNGWGVRRYEWQLGLGIQHELLPRLSAEVSFNRTKYGNLTATDQVGIGCDQFNGAQTASACQNGYLNYTSSQYDFFSVRAPLDPRLPGGGGYLVRGVANPKTSLPLGQPSAVTVVKGLDYYWNGVDTNFNWRPRNGLRLNGGTSTGRAVRDTCSSMFDDPQVQGRDGNNYRGAANAAGGFGGGGTPTGCRPYSRFQTNVRGSATYTVPWVDLLVSTVFQYRPGPARSAFMTFTKDQVIWEPNSAARATAPCAFPNAGQVGCFVSGANNTATTYTVNLLDTGDLYAPGYTIFDLKFAKNFRFVSRRLNIGVDVYNLFNSDAILGYNDTYVGTPGAVNNWGQAGGVGGGLLSPRFMRLQVQFDF